MAEAAPAPVGRKRRGRLARRVHAAYASAVFALDGWLRRRQNVFCYSEEEDVIFRISLGEIRHRATLGDGTVLEAGDPIIDIHLWNERIPLIEETGSKLSWGRRLSRGLDRSLARLCDWLAEHPEYDRARALSADMSSSSPEQSAQLLRLSGRFGFEPLERPPETALERAHRLGENMLILMLVLARNPSTASLSILKRVRTPALLSRAELERRYGAGRD